MAFGHSAQNTGTTDTAPRQSAYLKLENERTIRVLDQTELTYWRYYIPVNVQGAAQWRSIIVGKDGPLARHFNSIGKENAGYYAPQKRRLLNVLDRTLVQRKPDGTIVYPNANGGFTDGSLEVGPHNQVFIIDFGTDLLNRLLTLHERIRLSAPPYTALPIWEFDVRIVAQKTGTQAKDVTRHVIPDGNQVPLKDLVADLNLKKYDLNQFVRIWPDEAQERILAREDYTEVLKSLGWERPVPTIDVV